MSIRDHRHHDTAREQRHREALIQQLSAEILREAHDMATLDTVMRRVLTRPDVGHDHQLESALRAFGGTCRSEIEGRLQRQRQVNETGNCRAMPQAAFPEKFVPPAPRTTLSERELALRGFERLRRNFEEKLLIFDIEAGKRLLPQIVEFQAAHAQDVGSAAVERCKHDLACATARREQFLAEVESTAGAAVRAARSGMMDEATNALKRLSSIRAARPNLLSEERIEEIRKAIEGASVHFENREANRALVMRERSVADELQKLAAIVHDFHTLSHEIPIGDPRYSGAERSYLAAVREVRHHDQEWLADLMVELDELVEQVHDDTGRAAAQTTRFLHSVKASIAQIVREIRTVAGEQQAQPRISRVPKNQSGVEPGSRDCG